jgi:hypothetical protein
MRKKMLVLGVLACLSAGLARAEGSYGSMNLTFLLYAMAALGVMALQAIYVLCLGGIGIGKKLGCVLLLLVLDAVIAGMIISSAGNTIESPVTYIMAVIPGLIAIFIFKDMARKQS